MDFIIQNNSAEKSYVNKTAIEAFSPVVHVRRLACLPEEINQGHYAKAAGLTTLMAINLPEDTRDLKAAAKQIFTKEIPEHYKVAQAEFSFFRGTVLEPVVNKLGKIGVKLHQIDKTLYDTKLGKSLRNRFGVEIDDYIGTNRFIKQIVEDYENPKKYIIDNDIEVLALKLKGKPFGKLVGNTLLRIPVISTYIMAGLELPSIYRAFAAPEKGEDKAICGTAQIVKSTVNMTTITAAVGIFGALLKGKGPVGSLVGMGIGSVVGAHLSKQATEKIDNVADKMRTIMS